MNNIETRKWNFVMNYTVNVIGNYIEYYLGNFVGH